jgi:uncharacterized protein (TIGR03083 family)
MELDLPAIYAASFGRIEALMRGLSDDQAVTTRVPGTPLWSVHDLLAHLTAVATYALRGDTGGAGTPEWTGQQVAEREQCTLGQLHEEWAPKVPRIVDLLGHPGTQLIAYDIYCHEHDLRGALALEGTADPETTRAITGFTATLLAGRVAQQYLPALSVRTTEGDVWGSLPPDAVTVTAPTFELFRALFGRRSNAQVCAYEWSGDPAPYLDVWSFFGPLPSVDVVEGAELA